MSSLQVAVCDDVAIYGVGDTIADAMQAASDNGSFNGSPPPVVARRDDSTYDGGIVDLTTVARLAADSEAISGANGKLRRITPELAKRVAEVGGNVAFDLRGDGVLDIEK